MDLAWDQNLNLQAELTVYKQYRIDGKLATNGQRTHE